MFPRPRIERHVLLDLIHVPTHILGARNDQSRIDWRWPSIIDTARGGA